MNVSGEINLGEDCGRFLIAAMALKYEVEGTLEGKTDICGFPGRPQFSVWFDVLVTPGRIRRTQSMRGRNTKFCPRIPAEM